MNVLHERRPLRIEDGFFFNECILAERHEATQLVISGVDETGLMIRHRR